MKKNIDEKMLMYHGIEVKKQDLKFHEENLARIQIDAVLHFMMKPEELRKKLVEEWTFQKYGYKEKMNRKKALVNQQGVTA